MLVGQVKRRLRKKRKGLWMPIGCSSPWQAIFFGLRARRKNEGSLRIPFPIVGLPLLSISSNSPRLSGS